MLTHAGMWHDMEYSSDSTTASAYWNGFADPESGLDRFMVAVGSGLYDPTQNSTSVRMESYLPFVDAGLDLSWSRNTFNFRDGERVFVTVRAFNVAGLATTATTNGFIVDL
jgi:hypothetical protein